MLKKRLLFIAAILIITLFFSLPQYYNWLFGYIMHPPVSYAVQFKNPDPATRRVLRYGSSYVAYLQAVEVFKKAHITDPVILLPPPGYLKSVGVLNVEVEEPSEFYYHTGYKAVWVTSPDAARATWALAPVKSAVMLREIRDKADLDNLLSIYNHYKPQQ